MYTTAVFIRQGVEYLGVAELIGNEWLISLNLRGQCIRTLEHISDLKEGWNKVKALLDIELDSVDHPRLVGDGTDGPFGAEEAQ